MALRNMLNDIEAPYIKSLMELISTQSEKTLTQWVLDYCEKHLLPIYEKSYPKDLRIRQLIGKGKLFLNNEITKVQLKAEIKECQSITKEIKNNHTSLIALKAVISCVGTPNKATNSLALALFGALAMAYDRLGTKEAWEVYELEASKNVINMHEELEKIMIVDELKPAKINWYC